MLDRPPPPAAIASANAAGCGSSATASAQRDRVMTVPVEVDGDVITFLTAYCGLRECQGDDRRAIARAIAAAMAELAEWHRAEAAKR